MPLQGLQEPQSAPAVAIKAGAPELEGGTDAEQPANDGFTIKAAHPRDAVVVHLSVAAGPGAGGQQQGSGLAAAQQAAKGGATPAAPPPPAAAAAAAAAAAPTPQAATRPIPAPRGYRSLVQFGQINEVYHSRQSSVFKGVCLASGAPVILKRYSKAKMDVKADHKMRREIALMYQLRGLAGVTQILGHFEDNRYVHIVMEWAPGGDLYQRCTQQWRLGQPPDEHWVCTKVVAPLLRTLRSLHEADVVHRDIKPENLFLSTDDELLVGDFGLAIQQRQELPFLRAGTLDYMSPEVLRNPVSEELDESSSLSAAELRRRGFEPYNQQVDVWAVGVLAYELMMGGVTPFYNECTKQTEQLIQQCDLLPTRFPRHQMFSPWADFVRTILVHDPARRPTAAQLLTHNWIQQHERQAERLRHRQASLKAPQRIPVSALNRTASMPDLTGVTPRPAALPTSRFAAAGAAAVTTATATTPVPAKPLPPVGSACSVLDGFSSRSSMATATTSASPLGSARSTSGTAAPAAPAAPAAGSSSVPDVDMLPAGLPPSPFVAAALPPAPPRGIEAALAAEAARVAALYSSRSAPQASGSVHSGSVHSGLSTRGQPAGPMQAPAPKPAGAVGRVAAAIRRQTKTMLNKVRWPRASREGSRGGTQRSRSNSLRSVASCGSERDRSRGNSIISVGSGPGERSRSSSLFAPNSDRGQRSSIERNSIERP